MSHSQTLRARRFRKSATPTYLGVGRLVSLQAGASQEIWPSTVHAMLTVNIPVGTAATIKPTHYPSPTGRKPVPQFGGPGDPPLGPFLARWMSGRLCTGRRHSLVTFRGSGTPFGNFCSASRGFAANIAEPRCRRPTASGNVAVRLACTPVAPVGCPYGLELVTRTLRSVTR